MSGRNKFGRPRNRLVCKLKQILNKEVWRVPSAFRWWTQFTNVKWILYIHTVSMFVDLDVQDFDLSL